MRVVAQSRAGPGRAVEPGLANRGAFRGSTHHLNVRGAWLAVPADEGGRHDETVWAFRARAGARLGAVGRGHVVAGGGAQAWREAGVRAPLCHLDWRRQAGAEEALGAVPVEA